MESSVSEEKDKYDNPNAAMEFELERTRNPFTGKVPWDKLRIAIEQTEFAKQVSRNENIQALSWIERGPNGDFTGASGNPRGGPHQTGGRIRAVMVDSLDPTHKTVFVGSVAGGLWKTTDITASPANWTLVNDFLSNLAVADLTQDPRPGFRNIMYMATGESYSNSDAVRGVGVFKSTDGGATWVFLPSSSAFLSCTRILCDAAGNVYLGARNSGLQRSTDGGATWTNITPNSIGTSVCDLELSSTGRMHVTTGIFSTSGYAFTDNPSTVASGTWSSATTPFTTFNQRTELAVKGDLLYALPDNSSHQVPTIWKSTDGGANWASTAGQPATNWGSGQAWYNLTAAINPANPDECIVGALENYKTTNGGTSWTKISGWLGSPQYVHADMHNLQWYDGGTKLIFACDGGIHYSSDGGATMTDRNKGLRIKQFYSVAIHPAETNYLIAGAQDNGMHRLNHVGLDSSIEFYGGDGCYAAIDQNEPQYQFGSYVYNVFRRSTNNGVSWSTPVNNQSTGRFVNPWDYDNAGNIIYSCNNAGTFRRWDDPQTGATNNVITCAEFGTFNVSAVHVSPYTAHRVFFGLGTGGTVVRVDNANLNTSVSGTVITPAGATGYVNCVVTGSSDQHLIATVTNYGVTNVWWSNNGGTSWTACDGNLPDMPVRWALFHPDSDTKAFIATETGVWETDLLNGAATVWNANPTFPNCRTDMIKYRASDRTIAAGTHGRGIWTATVAPPSGFTFSNPAPATANCPAPATMDIVLGTNSNGGFTNPITVSATGAPGSTSVSFIPSNSVTPGNNVTVRLNGTNTLAPGTYNITVTGIATGAPQQSVNLSYIINQGVGPAITSDPASQTICAGANTSFNVAAATATSFLWQVSTDGGTTWTPVNNGGVYSGATTNTLNLTSVPASFNGNRYRAQASTVCGSTVSNAAVLTVNTPPVITSQPQNATVCAGSSQVFSVTATGSPLTYQWQLSTDGGGTWNNIANGGVYSGAGTAALTITGVTVSLNNNRYRVIVSGLCPVSPVTSNPAVLTVTTSISFNSQPVDVTVCAGGNASFSVTSTGATNYQWQLSTDGGTTWNNVTNGGVYSGATTQTLNLTGVTTALNGNRYRINISSGCGNINSNAALLTVQSLPAITTHPADATLCAGSNNTFSVSASGTGITYQWQVSTNGCSGPWNNISGANGPGYTLTGISAGLNNTGYRVIITGTCAPAVTSNCALLTVVTSVNITTQPINQTVCEGSNASFTAAGSGPGVIYQWQVSTDAGSTWTNVSNGGVYSGATSGTLSITGVTFSMNNYRYRAQMNNATCTTPAFTNSAILLVNTLPLISTHPQNATLCVGGNNTFSVIASGTGITYQWQLSTDGGTTWANISGANTSSYTVSAVTAGMNNYRYRVIVTGTCAPVATTNAAILTVISPVSITTQPANAEGCSGSNSTFSVSASSTQTVIYQWQVSTDGGTTWTNIAGANNSSYTVNGIVVPMNNNRYRVLTSSTTCSSPTVSNAAILTVRQLPGVGLSAAPVTSLLPGQVTTLTATPSASTGGTLTTSWHRDGTAFANSGNTFKADISTLGAYQVKIQETFASGLTCFNESPIVVITATASSKLFIFPSPNDGRFTVSYYNSGGAGTARTITIFDSKGAKVFKGTFSVSGLYTLIPITLTPAHPGIYYVVVGSSNGQKIADGSVMVSW